MSKFIYLFLQKGVWMLLAFSLKKYTKDAKDVLDI